MIATETLCGLCELPCGRRKTDRTISGEEKSFCCMGCANVYSILLESGIISSGVNIRDTELFRRSLELGLIAHPDEAEDEPARHSDPAAGIPTEEAVYRVGGMWCSACGWLIEHALSRLPGVVSAQVFFASDLCKIRYCPQLLFPDRIRGRIAELGYRPSDYRQENEQAQQEARDLILRLGVSTFLWANIMAFSTILYVGYFEQIAPSASRWIPRLCFLLATPLVFYCAFPILRTAALGLRHYQIRMETLLASGILTAYLLSTAQAFRGHTHVYFDTAAGIVTLVLAGKLIERRAKDRAARSVANLYRQMPTKVRIESPSGERFVSIDGLEPGAIFLVKSGERVPADGMVVDGSTEIDESLLTGESRPILKNPGDQIFSGSLNCGSAIRVRAIRTSDSSALASIIRLVERALSTRAPIERTVDRVAQFFVPAVMLVALAAFAVLELRHAGTGVALMRATTILVIACPCALGLATPLAITAAIAIASEKGILIADSRVLGVMNSIDTVVLDKTGTVTCGDFCLMDTVLFDSGAVFARDWLPLLAGIEQRSEHLLGRAVVRYAADRAIPLASTDSVEVHKGRGITGIHEGRIVFIGNAALVKEIGAETNAVSEAKARECQRPGHTIAFFGIDNRIAGILVFGDRIKSGAAAMVQRMRSQAVSVQLVSGDSFLTTEFVAHQIGIEDFISEATPEMKSEIIHKLQASGRHVAFLGDGVNDAPALAAATFGIAMGTGAEIAIAAAPVALVSGDLDKLDETLRLGRRATRIIRQNLFWAFFYNLAALVLALTGVITPLLAAAAMFLSSASVVTNSVRLNRPSRDVA